MKHTGVRMCSVLALALGMFAAPGGRVSDDQCYELAKNKDMALENTLVFYGSYTGTNPITLLPDAYDLYYAANFGESNALMNWREVWASGYTIGNIGTTLYVITPDGRARVSQKVPGALWGWGYGFGWNQHFPLTMIRPR
ncbi:MAG TPA: hypothetical protein VLY63_14555 [Anaerolineae bacterium]|nr:hypothetical protein [Anaerolineae bacterium]